MGRLESDQLRIDRLRLTTGKHQEVVAQGVVRLRPLTEPGLDLTARLHDFRISHSSTLQSSASGQLTLGGTALAPTLTGALTLGRSDVFVGNEAAAIKVKPVELTQEDYRKLARDFGPAVLARVHESPGLVSRFRLDLDLRLPERVWIRKRSSPSVDIELAGRMRLTQEPGQEMQFFGRVEPVPGRGVIGLSGHQFHLTGGEITLTGPTDSTTLDVTAEYQVPTQGGGEDNGVLITVAAKGRLDSLGLTFSADPEMSQDDIFSYIVTGRPASDNPLLAKQTGGGGAGEQIAMGQLTTAISNAAGQSLGLDVFQIRQDPSQGLTLTAGRYLSSQLFLNLQLPLQLGSRAQPTPGANLGPGFELEYAMRRWLRADVRGGSLPPGFSFRGRRAY
jgi:autotransporter translocation and assembly factor TamB